MPSSTPRPKRSSPISRDPIHELDRVRLTTDVVDAGHLRPAGSVGTVVHCYGASPAPAAFEVEFDAPFPGVLTLQAGQVEAA